MSQTLIYFSHQTLKMIEYIPHNLIILNIFYLPNAFQNDI